MLNAVIPYKQVVIVAHTSDKFLSFYPINFEQLITQEINVWYCSKRFHGTATCIFFATAVIILILIFLNIPSNNQESNFDNEQRQALMSFYEKTGGNSWFNSNGWNTRKGNICDWHGIKCYPSGDLRAINLSGNNLKSSGYDFVDIAKIKSLESIDVSKNSLSGTMSDIGANLSVMDNLHVVNFQENVGIKGTVPVALCCKVKQSILVDIVCDCCVENIQCTCIDEENFTDSSGNTCDW